MSTKHTNLLRFVDKNAVKRGEFTLASGLISNYYIDGKQVTSSPIGLNLLVDAIRVEIAGFQVDSVGGLEIGAIPIATAVAMSSASWDTQIPSFTVRKEKKTHGSRKRLEGIIQPGDRIAVVDDVVTTGGSIIQAIDAIKEAGCTVVVALAIVDRQSGAIEALQECGVPYRPLLTIEDLGLSNDHTRREAMPAACQ